MAQWELDSFYFKFKNLLLAEKHATLTLKAEAGRAFVSLSLDLGHILSGPDQIPGGLRNGPARQRRREKRAAARNEKLVTEKVEAKDEQLAEEVKETDATTTAEVDGLEAAVKAKFDEKTEAKKVTAEKATVFMEEPKDELCPDDQYKKHGKDKPNPRRRPSSFRGSDGVDYYTLTYEDPSDSY